MRVRKIHTVLAVSVALVLVARSIEGRRRAQGGSPAEPFADLPSEGQLGLKGELAVEVATSIDRAAEPPVAASATADSGTAGDSQPAVDAQESADAGLSVTDPSVDDVESSPEEHVALDESAALQAQVASEELPVHASPEGESNPPPTHKRRLPRGPLAVATTVVVLIAVLVGTVVAVAVGAI